MRGDGDIVLVSCYELGRQPLSLAWPLAFLRDAGYRPTALDLSVERLHGPALAAVARARLVAIAVPMHTALRLGVRVAARVRELNPAARIAFFGLYAPLNAEYLRREVGANAILGGEAERALVALADALSAGREPGGAPEVVLERLPLSPPAREGLPPLARYAKLVVVGEGGREERLAGAVEATRGCLHMCRHCPIPPVYGGRFFAVPVEVVLEDVRRQVAAGARHVTFADADFLNGPRHALAVARALHAEHPGLTFDVTVKVEHILRHRDVWPELARLGCVFVVSAVESLNDRTLAILDKGHTRADVEEALRVVRGAGLSLRPTFVAFTPWTTIDDYLELCRFVEAHELEDEVDPVQLSLRLLVPPGSLLLEREELLPHLGPLDERALTFTWTHPDPRMERLRAEIAALVERAARDDEPPATTFRRIHALAAAAAGVGFTPRPEASRRRPPPRLGEPWFC